jgi:hypothetical protein
MNEPDKGWPEAGSDFDFFRRAIALELSFFEGA